MNKKELLAKVNELKDLIKSQPDDGESSLKKGDMCVAITIVGNTPIIGYYQEYCKPENSHYIYSLFGKKEKAVRFRCTKVWPIWKWIDENVPSRPRPNSYWAEMADVPERLWQCSNCGYVIDCTKCIYINTCLGCDAYMFGIKSKNPYLGIRYFKEGKKEEVDGI